MRVQRISVVMSRANNRLADRTCSLMKVNVVCLPNKLLFNAFVEPLQYGLLSSWLTMTEEEYFSSSTKISFTSNDIYKLG